jgi:hypothetical protein
MTRCARQASKSRCSYRKPEDEELLPLVRRLVDARPIYGYRRIMALANSWRRRASRPKRETLIAVGHSTLDPGKHIGQRRHGRPAATARRQ